MQTKLHGVVDSGLPECAAVSIEENGNYWTLKQEIDTEFPDIIQMTRSQAKLIAKLLTIALQ